MTQAQKLEADFQLELDTKDKLKLITKRAITTHNSWTHNIDEFVSQATRDESSVHAPRGRGSRGAGRGRPRRRVDRNGRGSRSR